MKRGYRNFVKIYRKKLENVFKIGLKYTEGTVGECRASGAADSAEDEGCAGTAA